VIDKINAVEGIELSPSMKAVVETDEHNSRKPKRVLERLKQVTR
jgi:hypothetical protein